MKYVARLALGVIIALIVAMWTYGLFFASKESVNKFGDEEWAARAQARCEISKQRLRELADLRRLDAVGPDALSRRADIVDRATDELSAMVDELTRSYPVDAKGRAIVPLWESEYRTYISDRREYARDLRAGNNSPFAESTFENLPLSERLGTFARDNRMPSCAPPMDLSV
jgi:hypothetical protein